MKPFTKYFTAKTAVLIMGIVFFATIIAAAATMSYTSSTVAQASTANVIKGSINQEIIRIEVVTSGISSPLSATSFSLSTAGSSNATGDISIARLFYTGTSSTFATTTQVGNTYFDPPAGAFTITTSQELSSGTNYFWLTCNIKSTATTSNVVDARCTSINVGGARTPSITDPAGTRPIVANSVGSYCTPSGTNSIRYVQNVSFNSIKNPTTGTSGTYNDFTSISTDLYIGNSYELVVEANTSDGMFSYVTYFSVWIDFNGNGDFSDTGEDVLSGGPSLGVGGVYRLTADISPSSGTILGTTRMRVIAADTVPTACGAGQTGSEIEDYSVVFAELSPMSYVSCTSTQSNTTAVSAGSTTNEILGIQVVTTGIVNPLNVSSFTVPTSGTSNLTDIANAKLWYSGTDPSYGTTIQLGATVASPGATLIFSGFTQTLSSGTNYFWVTYDVICAASGAQIDAGCISATVSGFAKTPSTTAPAVSRAITTAVDMAYVSSTTTQNNSTVAKGETKQHIIGIEIVVTGCSSPMTSGDFTLCNSSTVAGDVSNAGLYYSGTSKIFSTATQVGSTVALPTACGATYTITTTQALSEGTNYFWLTYDISGSDSCDPNVADARCSTVVVGGVSRTPTVINPAGARTINCGTPYYSKGNLNVNTLSSWSATRDGTGAAPATFYSGYDFYVQTGHYMTASTAVTIPNVYMEYGSKITASYLLTMTNLMINNGATFEQTARATSTAYITNFYIKDGGTWIHNNTGYLPGDNRYFDANSNQWFYQWGGGTFPSGTAWGNVLLAGTTTGNFNLSNVLNTIQGDWEWRRIGNNNYLLSGSTETIDINGDLIFTGGWFKGMAGVPNGAKTLTLNVMGDLIMSSGTFNDFSEGNSGNKSVLTIGGNVNITGGTWNYNQCPDGLSTIILAGGKDSVVWTQTDGTVTLCNTYILSGKTVTMSGLKLGNIATNRALTVDSGATLNTAVYPVTGAGAMTVSDGAIIGLGAINATGCLTSTPNEGNIQVTGTRTFNTGATYVYNGIASPQYTGDQLPVLISGGLTMNNTASGALIHLTNSTNVTGALTLTAGVLVSDSATKFTINAEATISPVRGSATSFIGGFVDRQINAIADFEIPIGSRNGVRWRPMTITGLDSISRVWSIQFINSSPVDIGSTYDATDIFTDVNTLYYYDVSRTLESGSIDLKLWYEDADLGSISEANVAIGHWVSTNSWWNAWNKDMVSDWVKDASANWIKVLGIDTFSPLAFGGGAIVTRSKLIDFNAYKSFSIISILPNPVSDQTIVRVFNPGEAVNASVDVVDYTGQTIFRKVEYLNKGNNELSIDFSSYYTSIYLIKIKAGKYPFLIGKLVKQ